MITKWATSIANKLAELSGEDVSADQLEIYIYGLECFLNTFITIVLLFVWGVLSHTLGYTLICPQKHFDFLYRFAIIEVQEAAVENEAKLAAGFLARVLGTQNKGRLSYESYMYRPSRYAQTELYRKCGKEACEAGQVFP